MGWDVEILVDQITPRLTTFTARMKQKVAEKMDAVGQDMEDLGKDLAPVRTGDLRDSIKHEVDPGSLSLTFGNAVLYGGFVEFGTSRMAARSHIRPALEANQQKLLDAIVEGVLAAAD